MKNKCIWEIYFKLFEAVTMYSWLWWEGKMNHLVHFGTTINKLKLLKISRST